MLLKYYFLRDQDSLPVTLHPPKSKLGYGGVSRWECVRTEAQADFRFLSAHNPAAVPCKDFVQVMHDMI